MAITHNFVSAKPASSDPTIVGSAEWNDDHAVTFGTGAGDIAEGDHLHAGVYEPADATILKTGNASWIDLTDGGATTLHSHAGGGGDISGTGVVGQVAEFVTDTKTLQAAKLIAPAVNILTITNNAASTLALNITSAKTLTLTAADNYTLTIPATGTAALLGTANVFTAEQKINVNSTTALFVEQDGVKDNVFVVDTTNGRVGINAVPLTSLYILDAVNTAGIQVLHTNLSQGVGIGWDRVYKTGSNASSDLRVEAKGAGDLLLQSVSTGNVGIGFALPERLLHMQNRNALFRMDRDIDTVAHMLVRTASGDFTTIWKSYFFGVNATNVNTGYFLISDLGNAVTGEGTKRFIIGNTGNVGIGSNIAPSGKLEVTGDSDIRQLTVTGFTTQTLPVGYLIDNTATTNAVRNVLQLETQSTGTAANGLGAGLLYSLETATASTMQSAAQIAAVWVDATNATRKAKLQLSAYDTAARLGIEIEASGTEPKLGFYGVTPIVRAVLATGAGATVDNVITALQNLGLVKQS